MDKVTVLGIIERFRKILETKNVKINKIILYGSYAKENFHEGSDIDVIVMSEDFAPMDYWARIDLISEAIYGIFEPIEAVSFTPGEWETSDSFLVDYARDGEVVYAAQGSNSWKTWTGPIPFDCFYPFLTRHRPL